MSHTPGPWIIDGDVPEKLGFQGWLCTATGPLGRMEPVCHIEAVSAADVKLIAAAPDMAEALKLARLFVDKADRSPWQQAQLAIVDAALAKAGL